MWLWKKFWNTDIVGKTYILIILFIVIVATITIITRYNNANTNQVLNEQQNEVIQDAVQTEQIQQESTSEKIINIAQTQENTEKESITDKQKVESQEKSVIKPSKKDNKNTTQTETKEEVKTKVNKEETIVDKKVNTTEIIEENQEISNTQTLPETTKQEVLEKEEETQTDEKYTEIEVDVAEKKECNGNNHGIGVGNTGKWFNTKDEAIATYKTEIKVWGDKWTNIDNPISDDEYYNSCPTRL